MQFPVVATRRSKDILYIDAYPVCVDSFYSVFVSVSSKDILMIACCSNYLAGGELKEQKERRRIRTLWTRSVELWEMMSKKMDARFSSS